jgi:hypothetical protein
MKYYIVSIGAIFIALGIGILVGFNLNYDEALSKQQSDIIKNLDKEFEDLNSKNNFLQESLDTTQEKYNDLVTYIDNNYVYLIQNQLEGKNIGVISTTQDYDYKIDVSDIITHSGGNITFDITIKNDVLDQNKLEQVSKEFDTEVKSTVQLANYIGELLRDNKNKTALLKLEELGIIKINSFDDSYKTVDSLVLAGGSQDSKDNTKLKDVDIPLIKYFKQNKVYVLGVEQLEVENSYISSYIKNKIPTIDNINQGTGKISLILSLQKNLVGNYGVTENAQSLIPIK